MMMTMISRARSSLLGVRGMAVKAGQHARSQYKYWVPIQTRWKVRVLSL